MKNCIFKTTVAIVFWVDYLFFPCLIYNAILLAITFYENYFFMVFSNKWRTITQTIIGTHLHQSSLLVTVWGSVLFFVFPELYWGRTCTIESCLSRLASEHVTDGYELYVTLGQWQLVVQFRRQEKQLVLVQQKELGDPVALSRVRQLRYKKKGEVAL